MFQTAIENMPTSRGRVQLRSADPAAAPLIAPHYLSTAEDRRIAALAGDVVVAADLGRGRLVASGDGAALGARRGSDGRAEPRGRCNRAAPSR